MPLLSEEIMKSKPVELINPISFNITDMDFDDSESEEEQDEVKVRIVEKTTD